MEYSAVYDLDPLQMYLHALERPILDAAVQVPAGVIKAARICVNADNKIYFALAVVPDEPQSRYLRQLTARQVYEYTERHGGNIVAEYMQASRIYNAYGYIMHAAASAIHGAEYAAQWLQKWQEGKPAALAVFYNAAQCDAKQGKYIRACLDSLRDIDKEPQPLEEYADLEQMQAAADAIARNTPKEPQRAQIDADRLKEIQSLYLWEHAKIDLPAYAAAVVDAASKSKKAAARMLYKLWLDPMKVRCTRNYKTGKQEPVHKWATFRDAFAKACGVTIPNYKPNALKE